MAYCFPYKGAGFGFFSSWVSLRFQMSFLYPRFSSILNPHMTKTKVAGCGVPDWEVKKMSSLATAHIQLDNAGVAWIDDSNVKVIEVAMDKLAHGWNPEEIHFQHPHLSLAKIHAALSYYYDHQHDIDRAIERELQEVESLAQRVSQSPFSQQH
jgi:uncharacterized protein (DUF433 family)